MLAVGWVLPLLAPVEGLQGDTLEVRWEGMPWDMQAGRDCLFLHWNAQAWGCSDEIPVGAMALEQRLCLGANLVPGFLS